jgi:zinc transport system ATP-binding protein
VSADAVVSLREVDFAYGAAPVLSDVTCHVHDGDFVSIIGPNGGGKSTLMRLMLGLVTPRRGQVRLLGRPPAETRLRVGYMPQHLQIDPLFPMTVEDLVLTGRLSGTLPAGPYRGADRAAADAALAACEASDLRDRSFASLSGGQRQRVLIARALACAPEVLMLDEPTASLDPRVQDELYALLKRLNERMTVVIVSHDVSVVSQHVNRVFCVNVHVSEHCVTEIPDEMSRLFYGPAGLRLVRHDHDHTHEELDGEGHCE